MGVKQRGDSSNYGLMGVRQRGDASNYGLCSSCYEGLALGALNAWTHRLLDV